MRALIPTSEPTAAGSFISATGIRTGSSRRHNVYGNTAKEARDNAAEVRARLRANLPAKDRKITLGEFTAEWLDSSLEASDRKATTKNLYGTMAHTHIIGAKIGTKPLDKLRPSHIDAWTVEAERSRAG